jgi:uncharacterized protein (TIGR02271 family)
MLKKFVLNKKREQISNLDNLQFQLREEKLDIDKKKVKTGKVTIHKEVLREEKSVIVPVIREELVIEKEVLDEGGSNKIRSFIETIRIPISEERIEVTKHPVILEEVEIYKRQFQETKHIEETLKKEKIHLETNLNPEIIEINTD